MTVLLFYRGPLNVLQLAYSYVMLIVACIILIRALKGASALFARQNLMILAALAISLVNDILFSAGITPIRGYNLTPSIMAVTSLFIVGAVFRYRVLDLIPVARSTIFDTMVELMLVLDVQGRLVDINRSAQKALDIVCTRVIGRLVDAVLARRLSRH